VLGESLLIEIVGRFELKGLLSLIPQPQEIVDGACKSAKQSHSVSQCTNKTRWRLSLGTRLNS
jgi:hypothetical protein